MFDPVDPKQSLPKLEKGILQYWREEDVFKRSIHQRRTGDVFSFNDGPPFATGLPHYGHLLAGTIKDVIPRYQTMRGKCVERRFGWDCHGLPVENLIEKEHGIRDKRVIEGEIGISRFNSLCRASVQRYTKEWRTTVERMGRWVDMDYDYRTMDPDYMESIWWVFSELHKKNLIYEGHKPMHVCPRCVTPLSNFEVTLGYKDVENAAVTAKFKIKNVKLKMKQGGEIFALAWTTTPWTLPGNLFLAIGKNIEYVQFQVEGDSAMYVASNTFLERSKLKAKSYKLKANDLLGLIYEPLFPYFAEEYKDAAFRIVEGDFVSTGEGTGIVHIAPGFGEDDFKIGEREKVPLLQHVHMDGTFTDTVTDFAGMNVKEADPKIAEWLKKNGKLFAKESVTHSYPHCWRCDSPLLNYATSSWFVAVEKIKNDLLLANQETEWVPSHIRDGRFGKWLEGAKDWAISRNRYWGTPLPIWRRDFRIAAAGERSSDSKIADIEVISSRDDLMAHNLIRFTRITVLRHGESEGNLIPIYQGDIPGTDLTDRGKEQAARAASFVAGMNSKLKMKHAELPVSVVYHSPLARAKQTAEIIAEATGAKLIEDHRLREVSFGEYEGKTADFSDLTFVKERRAHKWDTRKPESIYHFPGMETWKSVHERIRVFLNEILPRHRSEHIVIVSHADPIMNIRHFFTQEDPFKLSHQPYPTYAQPFTFFYDHNCAKPLDLHKDTVDTVAWMGGPSDASVKLTFVRHGETDWNKERSVQGHADNPLNSAGKKQAIRAAESLKEKTYDVVISSDLKRAIETALIIADTLNIPERVQWNELRERDAGQWEGKTITNILEQYPNVHETGTVTFHYTTPPDGESLNSLLNRAQIVCQKILKTYPGKRVIVVGHNGINRAIRVIIENMTYVQGVNASMENTESVHLILNPLFQRVSEILDCWFESGSMPYAQAHYPFEMTPSPSPPNGRGNPSGFPADFIAEGIDQTRGWFYTLMVLSAALFKRPAFLNCITNGIVLTEDGQKMSKRLKNYPEPAEVIEKHGADALRFTLMHSPAVRGETLCFSEKAVEETLRNVLLPLWNAYGFFVTYTNAAGFLPHETRCFSEHPLDQWIRAEVQNLVNRMTEELDRYDLSAACSELFGTVDALTNWYIRLNRRRFAGKEGDESDRDAVFHTLYDTLLTLSQLLAPFCPFITEAIYLNLVPEEHGSVHLTDWPAVRTLSENERHLLEKQRILRRIVSLANSIRSSKKIKVRQPLTKASIAAVYSFTGEDRSILQHELNVKDVEFSDTPEDLVDIVVEINARLVGPRLAKRTQDIIDAGKRGEFEMKESGEILILDESLSPDEARISYVPKSGSSTRGIAADRGIVVALDTTFTDELKREGLTRDLIRTIQRLRKEAGLHMNDRILLAVSGLDDVVKTHRNLIEEETNATFGKPQGNDHTITLEKNKVTICFEKQ